MALTERYYSCALVESGIPGIGIVPTISLEPMLAPGYAQRDVDGDVSYLVAATDEAWAQFDAAYPNQDAQTGDPYRRRSPRTVFSFVGFGGGAA